MKTHVLWGAVDQEKSKVAEITRPSWDNYFLKLAMLVSERSTCRRRHVGAVFVQDKQIVSTGYNGAPAKMTDCLELGCLRDQLGIESGTRHEICRATHAEQNGIIQAARHGVSLEGATVYCTHTPCVLCAKMLVNAKIKRFVSFSEYTDDSFMELFRRAGVEFSKIAIPGQRIDFVQ
jgi:dCMP deaminase